MWTRKKFFEIYRQFGHTSKSFASPVDSPPPGDLNACPCLTFFLPVALWPNAGHGLLILEVSRSHTTTHHSRSDSSRRVISSSQRPLPDNTQRSQQTNFHALGGLRTHNLSRRVAVDLRLRPRGHRGLPLPLILIRFQY